MAKHRAESTGLRLEIVWLRRMWHGFWKYEVREKWVGLKKALMSFGKR